MKSYDRHSVYVDVKDDGSDVWEAIWANDGVIRVYRGDSQNNRILMQHLMTIDFELDESINTEHRISMFVDFAYELLEGLVFENAPELP